MDNSYRHDYIKAKLGEGRRRAEVETICQFLFSSKKYKFVEMAGQVNKLFGLLPYGGVVIFTMSHNVCFTTRKIGSEGEGVKICYFVFNLLKIIFKKNNSNFES